MTADSPDLYALKLHESVNWNNGGLEIIRVPGGWIYRFMRLDCNQMNAVFVPFNNEFQE